MSRYYTLKAITKPAQQKTAHRSDSSAPQTTTERQEVIHLSFLASL